MTAELIRLFTETGLVQFGRFQHSAQTQPFLASLEYLAAYPDTLHLVTQTALQRLTSMNIQRLVATSDAVPFGVALSLQTGLSLVYSRGGNAEAVYDLVGAYNIGHDAVLLTNVLSDSHTLVSFIAAARRVGLEIHTLLTILDLGISAAIPGVQVKSLLTLPGIVEALTEQRALPEGQARAVLEWINTQRANRHPGAASP